MKKLAQETAKMVIVLAVTSVGACHTLPEIHPAIRKSVAFLVANAFGASGQSPSAFATSGAARSS